MACGDDGGLNQLPDAPVFPDPDSDLDGILDSLDNCDDTPNADQLDTDDDDQGDACDTDDDNDGVLDTADNCPLVPNTDQANSDTDGDGDACDGDADGDGILDTEDNCPGVTNDQSDLDGDGMGDACDLDDDNDTILDAVDNCPTIPNTEQTDGDADNIGDSCDGAVVPSFEGAIKGGNLAAAGSVWAARFNSGPEITAADITLSTVPAGATIRKASLYWTTIGEAVPTVTFNGTAITGTEIGQTPDTCWGIGNNFMYRADVTAMVTGNGTFSVTNIVYVNPASDGQGASLVVLYVDPTDQRINFVSISDGADPTGVATSVDGFTVGAGFDKATAINIVADGQPNAPDVLLINGTDIGGGDAFIGVDGGPAAMWDTRIDDITTLVTAGATTVSTQVVPGPDCLAWEMSAVVIEDVTDQVAPPIEKRVKSRPRAKASKSATLQRPATGMRPVRGRLVH